VCEVYAETAIASVVSCRVLEKNGFNHMGRRTGEDDDLIIQGRQCRRLVDQERGAAGAVA
jgi:RimJ/RimL family protein N-acetyltransferase